MDEGERPREEIDINLRSADTIARRCIILLAVMQRIGLDAGAVAPDEPDPAAIAFDTREWLRAEGLWDDLTADERKLLSGPPGAITPDILAERGFQTEALAALAWSLGLVEILSDTDYTDVGPILASIPSPWDKVEPWTCAQTLRPEPAIARRREQAEIWHWRLAVEPYRRLMEGRDLMDLEKAIKDVERDGTKQGLLSPGKKGGFTIEGIPLVRIHPFELEEYITIAEERLLALNWVCGFGDDWDSVPLEI